MSSSMSGQPSKVFKCPACGAGFKGQPQYAGRKITCKCGKTFLLKAPAAPATIVPQDDYNIAPEHEVPKPKPAAEVVREAELAPAPVVSSLASAYGPRKRAVAEEEQATEWVVESPIKHTYAPLALLFVGVLARVLIVMFWPARGNTHSVARNLLGAGVEMCIYVALGLMALFIAASFLGVNFGPIAHAARKMAAMAIFAALIGSLCVRIDRDPHSIHGMVLAIHMIPIVYWIMMYALFDLDLQETLLTVAVIGVLQGIAACVIMKNA